jgi:hypothetical protein
LRIEMYTPGSRAAKSERMPATGATIAVGNLGAIRLASATAFGPTVKITMF